MKINWALYNDGSLPQSLCVGEEKQLTDAEVETINESLAKIAAEMLVVRELFQTATNRFIKR